MASNKEPARFEAFDDVASVAAEWEALAARSGASPFARPGWIGAWYTAFGGGRPFVATLRGAAGIAAVAALELRAGTIRSAANWHTPLYDVVAEDAEAARALADGILALRPRRLELRFLDAGGFALTAFRDAAQARGYRLLMRTLEESPYVATDGDWDDYTQTISQTMLKELARRRRGLERRGTVSFTVDRGDERLEEALEAGFRLEGSGWKGRGGTAIVSRPETREFYTAVARWAAERGWLRLAFLEHEGRPIAFQFDLEAQGVLYHLKPGYDEAFARFRPGKLLTQELIRSAFERGLESYEFLGAADPHKLEWAHATRERLLLQAFAPTPPGLGELAVYRFGRPAALRARAAVERARALRAARAAR